MTPDLKKKKFSHANVRPCSGLICGRLYLTKVRAEELILTSLVSCSGRRLLPCDALTSGTALQPAQLHLPLLTTACFTVWCHIGALHEVTGIKTTLILLTVNLLQGGAHKTDVDGAVAFSQGVGECGGHAFIDPEPQTDSHTHTVLQSFQPVLSGSVCNGCPKFA